MSTTPADITASYNGIGFILGSDIGGPQLGLEDLGQILVEVEPDMRHMVDHRVTMYLEAAAPIPAEECYIPHNEPTFTPNHRKHNKRGKFKRSTRR